MKPTYQTAPLSGSTNYLPINITATTAANPTLIHTADATNTDELWLDAHNYSNFDAFLHLMLGGSAAYQIVTIPIPSKRGIIPVIKGQRFTGSVVISAYASVTDAIAVLGQINKIVFI